MEKSYNRNGHLKTKIKFEKIWIIATNPVNNFSTINLAPITQIFLMVRLGSFFLGNHIIYLTFPTFPFPPTEPLCVPTFILLTWNKPLRKNNNVFRFRNEIFLILRSDTSIIILIWETKKKKNFIKPNRKAIISRYHTNMNNIAGFIPGGWLFSM